MSFNLKRAKRRGRRHPIDDLREIIPGIRYSDLDTDDDGEISSLIMSVSGRIQKEAVHGRGDNWTEVGPGFNPYRTDPLVNPTPTGFGNQGLRNRRDMPSGGDMHINDSNDKKKNTKGRATDEAFDPNLRRKKINDQLEKARKKEKGDGYLVRIDLGPDGYGDEETARNIFGEDGQFDDTSVYMEVDNFEKAVRIEREQKERGRSARIESKHEEEEEYP